MADDDKSPQEWRELLSARFDYPEETKEGRRRQRRRARRAFRDSERRRTKEWIKRERRREPITAVGALLIVGALLLLGVLARIGPDWLSNRDETAAKPTPTPTAPAAPAPPPVSTSPTPSKSSSAAPDRGSADKVATEFVRRYLTRNPPKDEDHTAAVLRAEPWATSELVENLSNHSDPAFDKLVSRGGVSTVSTVKVKPPEKGLPVDSPLRVWRAVTAKVDVQGYTNYSEKTTLQIEVTKTDDGWRVSRILGA
ncbi:hypothetical protein ACF1HU_35955 [Streptomyces olivaceus]|uniref:hypothetical protein n=1 Tax=Streptomyces olivaceus TaxID=47716 RepID=UPI0036FAEA30